MSLEERKPYIARCPRCSQCKWVPSPKSEEFAAICPSIEYGKFHSYSAGGKGFTAYALAEGRVGYSEEMLRSIYACTMCGACDTACKTNFGDNIEPLDTLYALRAEAVETGHALPVHQAIIDNLKQDGNPMGKPRGERARYAEGLHLKDIMREPAEVLLHVGCEAAYDEEQWSELHFAIDLLKKAKIDFGIAGNAEVNSGGGAYDLGFQAAARELAETNVGLIETSGAKTVIAFSADAYAAFKNIYPRLGMRLDGVRILHISEFIDELTQSGKLRLRGKLNAVVTYHDPCKLGRLSEPHQPWDGEWKTVLNVMYVADPPRKVLFGNGGNYDAPRRLLGAVEGVSLTEMERVREISYCCGASGGGKEAFPDFGEKTARDRLAEAESTGASILVTACGGCKKHLGDAAKRSGSVLEVKSLFELLSETALAPAESI